jgi:hypothetical protein
VLDFVEVSFWSLCDGHVCAMILCEFGDRGRAAGRAEAELHVDLWQGGEGAGKTMWCGGTFF